MTQQPSSPQEERPEPVQAHVTIAEGLMRWECPRCHQSHTIDVRPLVAEEAIASVRACDGCGVRYFVWASPQVFARVRRALGIPGPVYPTPHEPAWRLPAEWKREQLVEQHGLSPGEEQALSDRAERLALDDARGRRQVFAYHVEQAFRQLRSEGQ